MSVCGTPSLSSSKMLWEQMKLQQMNRAQHARKAQFTPPALSSTNRVATPQMAGLLPYQSLLGMSYGNGQNGRRLNLMA